MQSCRSLHSLSVYSACQGMSLHRRLGQFSETAASRHFVTKCVYVTWLLDHELNPMIDIKLTNLIQYTKTYCKKEYCNIYEHLFCLVLHRKPYICDNFWSAKNHLPNRKNSSNAKGFLLRTTILLANEPITYESIFSSL